MMTNENRDQPADDIVRTVGDTLSILDDVAENAEALHDAVTIVRVTPATSPDAAKAAPAIKAWGRQCYAIDERRKPSIDVARFRILRDRQGRHQ